MALFGIHILQNLISVGALPRTLLGEVMTLRKLLVCWGVQYFLPILHPLDAFGVLLLMPMDLADTGDAPPQTQFLNLL